MARSGLQSMSRNKWLLLGIVVLAVGLRLVQFGSNPPSLYWEEVALGYDAYSLLITGKDHHGHTLPLVALESFGDWKPPLYTYAIMPFIPLFGLSAIAVRLPSLLAGLSMLFAVYLLAKKMQQNPLIVVSVTAISPWAIQFSRFGWEAHLATAFMTWGLYFGVMAVESDKKFHLKKFATAIFFLVISLYTYHAARIVAPLLGLGIVWFIATTLRSGKIIFAKWRQLLLVASVTVLLILPILLKASSPEILQRSRETSIFSDISIITTSNQLREAADNSLISRLVYHRYLLFAQEIAKNFLAHFSPQYLFLSGDAQVRHSVQFFGHLYHVEIIFVCLGFFIWIRKRTNLHWLLLFTGLLAVLPAAISTGAPHALRSMMIFPIFMLLVAEGIQQLVKHFTPHKLVKHLVISVVICIYLLELRAFWLYYSTLYPKVSAHEWQSGYAEMVKLVEQTRQAYPDVPIYISRAAGRPAMYYWFFSKTDPRVVQAQNSLVRKDQGEYLEFNNLYFYNSASDVPENLSMIVATPDTKQNSWIIEVR